MKVNVRNILEFIRTVHRRLVLTEKALLCLLLFAIISFSFAQVVMRNLFSFGLIWINEALRVCVIWITFIGASLAAEEGRHLRIDIVQHLLKQPGPKRLADALANGFTAIVSILLLIASVQYIALIKPYSDTSSFFNVPEWILRLVIPYAFTAMAIRCGIYVFKNTNYAGGEPKGGT